MLTTTHHPHPTTEQSAPPDILKGAAAIAAFLFGSATRRREVYHLVEKGSIPTFKLGSTICARRSTLTTWIAQMEGIQ